MNKPTTLEECMAALTQALSEEDRLWLAQMKEEDLITTHHSVGGWIRNNWDLWKGGLLLEHLKSLGFIHPDDMSSSIIREWWARNNNKPSTLQQDIKEYAEYWSKK
jgi:hypothetical protein